MFTCDVFESQLQSDVHNHLVCYLVMLMNCNYCYCGVFGSMFYFCDVFKSVFDTGDVFCNSIFVMCLNHVSKVMSINIVLQSGDVNELQ
jgi:hypothetical protein